MNNTPKTESLKSVLTPIEHDDLARLEVVIERGMQSFVEVGNALLEVNDRRLYREQFSTFQEYCQSKWNMTARRAYQLCEAAEVVKQLPENVNHGSQINERQVRELAKVEPDKRVTVIQAAKAISQDDGLDMTARDIRKIAKAPARKLQEALAKGPEAVKALAAKITPARHAHITMDNLASSGAYTSAQAAPRAANARTPGQVCRDAYRDAHNAGKSKEECWEVAANAVLTTSF
jgi:hypothetical protein